MKRKREWWHWVFLGTAGVMLIAVCLFAWSLIESSREGARVTASSSPRTGGGVAASTYETLSRVYAPAYRQIGSDLNCPSEFRAGMSSYGSRDYSSAIPLLQAAAAKDGQCLAARLYLGICQLVLTHRQEGVTELRKVTEAGESPYLEQARFYMAKGLLGSGDLAGAREQLNETIALHGDLSQQSETLLARIK